MFTVTTAVQHRFCSSTRSRTGVIRQGRCQTKRTGGLGREGGGGEEKDGYPSGVRAEGVWG